MSMSKQDYEAIAEAIREFHPQDMMLDEHTQRELRWRIGMTLEQRNPTFDYDRFMDACIPQHEKLDADNGSHYAFDTRNVE